MNSAAIPVTIDSFAYETGSAAQGSASAVSWGAIFAGAAVAAALSLILLILGTGLGLSSGSAWANQGPGVVAFGVSTILWVTLTQILASGLGGYLAGRLRSRWVQAHPDEIHFSDTAHGLLAWSIASLATAVLLTSTIGSIVHGGLQAGAAVGGGVATVAASAAASGTSAAMAAGVEDGPMGYFVDSLFRANGIASPAPATTAAVIAATSVARSSSAESSAEVTRIFLNTIRTGALSPEDSSYVGGLVAARTGLSQEDAEQRVSDVYAAAGEKLQLMELEARVAADKARSASAAAALWLFISLLVGAFVAALAATYGGRQRDR